MGFECGHVDRGWPDLGIELPPLAPASRRPTPALACARREGQGSAEQRGGRGGGSRSHADDDRARWGRRNQGWRITRTRTTPLWKRRPGRTAAPNSASADLQQPTDQNSIRQRGSFWRAVTAASRRARRASESELSGDGDGRRPTGAERWLHMPKLQVCRGGATACAAALARCCLPGASGGHSLRPLSHTAIIWRIYKSRGKTRRS